MRIPNHFPHDIARIAPLILASVLTSAVCAGQDSGKTQEPSYLTPHCDSYSLQTFPKLTLEQRACIWRDQLVTGTAISGAAFWGAVGEWRHKPPEWPQGLNGFSRQFGTRYAQGMAKSTGTFVAAALLREDPRALPPADLECAGRATKLLPRVGQSLLRVVWVKTTDCKGRPRIAPLAGSFASGFVSLAWAPPSVNKLNSAFTGSGTAFAGYLGNSVFTEFQGDIFGFIGKMLPKGKKP